MIGSDTGHFSFKKADEFHDAISTHFCPMEFNQLTDDFNSQVQAKNFMQTNLTSISTRSRFNVVRNQSHIHNLSQTTYLVKFQLKGKTILTQRDKSALLKPGDFIVCCTSEPYELQIEDNNLQAVLSVPEKTMQDVFEDVDNFLGVKMPYEKAPHSILSNVVKGVTEHQEHLAPQLMQRLEANILDLLGTSLYAESNHFSHESTCSKQSQIEEIKRIIKLNLDNPNLSIEFITQQMDISTRYLHMIFKSEGISVSRYIMQQRLSACAKALTHPDYQHHSSTDIAMQWCFSDSSHFNRCFKACYGLTPGQYRNRP